MSKQLNTSEMVAIHGYSKEEAADEDDTCAILQDFFTVRLLSPACAIVSIELIRLRLEIEKNRKKQKSKLVSSPFHTLYSQARAIDESHEI